MEFTQQRKKKENYVLPIFIIVLCQAIRHRYARKSVVVRNKIALTYTNYIWNRTHSACITVHMFALRVHLSGIEVWWWLVASFLPLIMSGFGYPWLSHGLLRQASREQVAAQTKQSYDYCATTHIRSHALDATIKCVSCCFPHIWSAPKTHKVFPHTAYKHSIENRTRGRESFGVV